MPLNTQLDARRLCPLFLPYNITSNELDATPRLVDGNNAYVTKGGNIKKRPGIETVANSGLSRMDSFSSVIDRFRLYTYKTLEDTSVTPPSRGKSYLLLSFPLGSNVWRLYWCLPGSAWTSVGSGVDSLYAPHEINIADGKAYIRGFNVSPGTQNAWILNLSNDGSPVVTPWGIASPTIPARIVATKFQLNGAIDGSTTTLTVDSSTGAPATPFNVYIDYEQITVTNVSSLTWTITRGVGGTAAVPHDDNSFIFYRNWAATTYAIEVYEGWQYVYAYKSITGHISNRSPLETDRTQNPSNTGPFYDKRPQITYPGNSDTTNITHVVFYRTSDGGGTFYELETLANPGIGSHTYTDDSLNGDPVPDQFLNQASLAPTLTSNTYPIPNVAPKVIGTSTMDPCTPLALYASRHWFAIKNVLVFSSNEELDQGITWEAFNSDDIRGNYISFPERILYLISTKNGLYIIGELRTYLLTGGARTTFDVRILFDHIGGNVLQPRAYVGIEDWAYFLTNDNQIVRVTQGRTPEFLSKPVAKHFITSRNFDTLQFVYFAKGKPNWLMVFDGTVGASQQFVMDIDLTEEGEAPFWFVPWSMPVLRAAVGDDKMYTLVQTASNAVALSSFQETKADETTNPYFDSAITLGNVAIDFHITTSLLTTPNGNHVNTLREPGLVSPRQWVDIDMLDTVPDASFVDRQKLTVAIPEVTAYFDSFWNVGEVMSGPTAPPRRKRSYGYTTLRYAANDVANRASIKVSVPGSWGLVEIAAISVLENPDGGA